LYDVNALQNPPAQKAHSIKIPIPNEESLFEVVFWMRITMNFAPQKAFPKTPGRLCLAILQSSVRECFGQSYGKSGDNGIVYSKHSC
jgi:hypothetical protein